MSIIAVIGLLIGLIPFLGALNWINIPFALVGLILSIVGTSNKINQGLGITGIVLCAIVIFVGVIRLFLGGGII